jgi:RNA polymerase sigma factor (sigma-70 family)
MAIQKAIEGYNKKSKVKLSTYAYVLIRNAVYDYANKMKLHYQYKTLPLNENILDNGKEINLEAAYIVEEMRDSPYYEWLRDYFIYEDSQREIAKRYKTNQQNVSRIIVEFREQMKEDFSED